MASEQTTAPVEGKGKDKAIEPTDMSMDEDDSSSEEEHEQEPEIPEEEDEDNMEEISTENIVSGGRTRGKQIDFQKAAAEMEGNEEDEEDDEDFHEDDEMED